MCHRQERGPGAPPEFCPYCDMLSFIPAIMVGTYPGGGPGSRHLCAFCSLKWNAYAHGSAAFRPALYFQGAAHLLRAFA